MGTSNLEDLLKQLQQRADAQKRGGSAPQPQPQQRSAEPPRGADDDNMQRMREAAEERWRAANGKKAAQQSRRPAPTEPATPRSFANRARREPDPLVEPPSPGMAEVVHDGNAPVGRQVLNAPAATSRADQRTEHPLVQRLRQPNGAREAILLSEILRRPQPGRRFSR